MIMMTRRKWNRKYDWESWFARRRVTLRRGRDYHCTQTSICQQARNAASRFDLRISIEDQGDGVRITVTGSTDDEA